MRLAPIQAMDVTTLKAVLAELRPLLVPSRFEKAQQPAPHRLELGLRGLHGRHWLEIAWQADAPRLLAIEPPPRRGEGSTLAQQLQHGLGGLALVGLEQQGWERVVQLHFAARPGESVRRRLVVELMGRHSNLFLLDETGRVMALARQVRPQQSRLRPIGSGDAYTAPPPLQGDPPDLDGGDYGRWRRRLLLVPVPLRLALQHTYQGISPSLARQLAGDAAGDVPIGAQTLLERPVTELEEADWQRLWARWCRWLEDLRLERFGFVAGDPTAYRCWGVPVPGAVNAPLAAYYGRELGRRELEERRQQLEQRLLQARDRQERQRAEQQVLLEQVDGSDDLQRQADALLCLPEPSREQVAEAQALYRRARRLRRSVAAIQPRLELHRLRLERLEASLAFLGLQESPEQLQELEGEVEDLLRRGGEAGPRGGGERRRRRHDPAELPSPLELRTPDGLRVQVGRNHRQNEWISLRQARRGDLWFHAQECPGSHVMLKSSERPASERDLQAAADLAAHFSRARGNTRVPVVMVPGDALQRMPGAGPGTVRHRGGTVLWADPQRASGLLLPHARLPSLGAEPMP